VLRSVSIKEFKKSSRSKGALGLGKRTRQCRLL